METISYLISNYSNEIFLAFSISILGLFVFLIILLIKVSGLKKRYKKMFAGNKVTNIEEMLLLHKIDVDNVIKSQKAIDHHIGKLEQGLSRAYAKSAIYKYDAFTGLAGKLSFVYVLLDSMNSGVMLNGIFSNEGHYLYIKEITNGKTEKELSKEEKGTLEKAITTLR